MRTSLALLSLPIALSVACGDNSSPGANSSTGGAGAAQAGSTSGGAPSGGAGSGSAGMPAGTAGASSGATSAGSGTTAGQGGTMVYVGGSSSGGSGTGGTGGTPSTAGSGTGGGGGAGTSGCTRELLKATVDAYFKALTTHAPTSLPLATTLKFTENGKASKLGDEGLWKTAGTLKYAHSAYDTETCMSASEAVVPDGTTDVPMALRLKLVDQKLTEIEHIVARAGDYPALAANPAALAASKDVVKWEESVPADQRAEHAELTAWMEKYFKQFPAGVCNTTSDCKRMENGGGSFVCGQGASCASGPGSGNPVMTPRLVMADVETGLGVGFTIFTGGYTDMHMFKMYGGKVYAVSAILANADSSGWD
jgi:hypothetical protein